MTDDLFPWLPPARARHDDWFVLEPFQPAVGLANPHVQTLWSRLLPAGRGLRFQRERIETADGDFLDMELVEAGAGAGEGAPVVLLLPGLEGQARGSLVRQTYLHLAAHGIRTVGMNYRGCSGELNRTARLYHAGATDDVAAAHDWLDRRFPGVAKGMVGISLGGNLLLKYLGEGRETLGIRLRGAAVLSPPFDLALAADSSQDPPARPYAQRFLRRLQAKARAKSEQWPGVMDLPAVLAAGSLRQFDEAFTAPLHGFAGADDYYERCSARRYLAGVRVPTLLLRSKDDPLIPEADIPHDLLAANPALLAGVTAQGGHVGWVEGRPFAWRRWAERQTARFLAACLLARR